MHTAQSRPLAAARRVLVFRALPGLGDMLCAVPALRALRAAAPHAEIVLVGLEAGRRLAARFPQYVDRFLRFPGHPALPDCQPDPTAWPEFLREAQHPSADLAIQMHGSGRVTNLLLPMLGAERYGGFYIPGQYCPDGDLFFSFPAERSEVQRWIDLVVQLGGAPTSDRLEFPVTDADRGELRRVRAARALEPHSYVCIHPGASDLRRRWPAECFSAIADAVASRGFHVVLTGAAGERDVLGAVQRGMRARALNFAWRLSIGGLAALLQHSRILICNDTGVSHLASALQLPSVVIFTGSNPQRWAPANRLRHRVVAAPGLMRLPEHQERVTAPNSSSATRLHDGGHRARQVVSIDEVKREVDQLLDAAAGVSNAQPGRADRHAGA